MKKKLRFYLLCAAMMLTVPAAVFCLPEAAHGGDTAAVQEPASAVSGEYHVLRHKTGTVEAMPVREYLIGAVAAEMPASFAPDALTAQAVASHTYAERIRMQNAASPKESLCGADFSDNSAEYQAYFDESQRRAEYGTHYDDYEAKIEAAVDAAGGLLLCAADKPIIAAFHASSAGQTESAEDIFGMKLSYLTPVASEGDLRSPYYRRETVLPEETVRKALCKAFPAANLQNNPAEWLTVTKTSASGSVLALLIGSVQADGQAVRSALGLRSACFSAAYDAENHSFLFTVSGSGHGVGMSQYGANEMAKRGSNFRTILAHYYPGAELLDFPVQTEYNKLTDSQ